MMPPMRDPDYLDFIRGRVCSFCASAATEPHHSLRQLAGMGAGGMRLKGPDYAAIPACRPCHLRIHGGALRVERVQLLEAIVVNLVCFVAELKSRHPSDSDHEQL
jgi:hypothetical protein